MLSGRLAEPTVTVQSVKVCWHGPDLEGPTNRRSQQKHCEAESGLKQCKLLDLRQVSREFC